MTRELALGLWSGRGDSNRNKSPPRLGAFSRTLYAFTIRFTTPGILFADTIPSGYQPSSSKSQSSLELLLLLLELLLPELLLLLLLLKSVLEEEAEEARLENRGDCVTKTAAGAAETSAGEALGDTFGDRGDIFGDCGDTFGDRGETFGEFLGDLPPLFRLLFPPFLPKEEPSFWSFAVVCVGVLVEVLLLLVSFCEVNLAKDPEEPFPVVPLLDLSCS